MAQESDEALKPRDYGKLLQKLDRPPSGLNWVRFIETDAPSTAKKILSFLYGGVTFTYQPSYAVIKDGIELGISRETAIATARKRGAPDGRLYNEQLIEAFYAHQAERNYQPTGSLQFNKELFRISRNLTVPISPLSVIRENGRFVPIFVCGWAELQLSEKQRRLYVTICEDAFLSLTDFQNSPAEFLFFQRPRKNQPREAEIWQRGDYKQLPDNDLSDCVETYLAAREIVRATLEAARERTSELRRGAPELEPSNTFDLFSGLEKID
ncbi:hypothetical protein [uncultured Aureimonas sp.]|uniref:hypothetical protein n=1 Tax=uncultured Aureimonas sp. TaxID=1604662 RepID=UPI0025DA7EF9|nr:hypothetical protein [uncultured Aureimonas sp.]